jgi:hypothetical protein
LYLAGCHFARGAFAIFRADGHAALESADAMDASGLKLYAMIASAIRFLYFTNRGEFAKAAPHREQVELHAATVGSAWQVELWEPPALIPVYTGLSDLVEMTRICDRLTVSSKQTPSLELHKGLGLAALALVRNEVPWAIAKAVLETTRRRGPRSFIGWSTVQGFVARAYNQHGAHELARATCLDALQHLQVEDQEYVALYLYLEVQLAHADAGLGDVTGALKRIDGLLERHKNSDHPLLQGSLHEARAQIAWAAGMEADYTLSLAKTELWFRPTGTPALIAKCERLAELVSGPKPGDGVTAQGRRRRGGAAVTTGRLQAVAEPAPEPRSPADEREGPITVASPRNNRRR